MKSSILGARASLVAIVACAAIQSRASSASAEIKMDPSVPAAVQTQIHQDLNLVGGMQGNGSTGLFKKIFGAGNLSGANLTSFFSQRIFAFNMSDCGGGPGVAACVQPFIDSHTMWLTQNYVTFNIPDVYRISIIFHEARHTEDENSNWMHAYCPVPYKDENGKDIVGIVSGTKMEGLPACDTTPFGSYGLQAILLINIEKFCTNCSQKILMDAKLYGDDTVKRMSDLAVRKQVRDDLN